MLRKWMQSLVCFMTVVFPPPKKSNDKILIDSVMMNLRRYVVRLARHFKVVPAGGVPKWVASNTTNVKTMHLGAFTPKGKLFWKDIRTVSPIKSSLNPMSKKQHLKFAAHHLLQ